MYHIFITLYCTLFDPAGVFGYMHHELIEYTLKPNHLPECGSTYITNLYSRLSGAIKGPPRLNSHLEKRLSIEIPR